MGQKFYAVKNGRKPGIYLTWDECKEQTAGFSGATFKSFTSKAEAEAFMGNTESVGANSNNNGIDKLPEVYAFTDGSYNATTKVYGFGGFLHAFDNDYEIRGHANDPDEAVSRNVSGEVHGAIAAMKKAVELGIKEMTLFYDYEGVEKWPTKAWKTNKKISQFYVEEYEKIKNDLTVNFCHVKAHTGIPGNELADKIAKEEVGLE